TTAEMVKDWQGDIHQTLTNDGHWIHSTDSKDSIRSDTMKKCCHPWFRKGLQQIRALSSHFHIFQPSCCAHEGAISQGCHHVFKDGNETKFPNWSPHRVARAAS